MRTRNINIAVHSFIAVLVSIVFAFKMEAQNIDSLKSQIPKDASQKNYYQKFGVFINACKESGNIEIAIEYLNEQLNDIKIGDYKKDTISANHKALLLMDLGILYQQKGNYPNAQSCFINAYNLFDKLENLGKRSRALFQMANLYRLQKQSKKALEVNFQVLQNKSLLTDNEVASVYNNIALIYDYDLAKTDSALLYYNKGLEIYIKTNNKRGISTTSGNISGALTVQGKYDLALNYRLRSLKIDIETNDSEGQIYSYWGLGEIYHHQQIIDSAEKHYLKALAIAQQLKLDREESDAHAVLADFYASIKNFDKAYEHQITCQQLKEKIFNDDMAKSLSQMQTQFDTKRKEQEIKLLQQDQQIKQSNLDKQKQIIIWGILVIVLIVGLLFLFIKSNNERKKVNLILSHQKAELEKLSIVASETNNAVLITDSEGNILWINQEFERLYKITLDKILKSEEINVMKLSTNPDIAKVFENCIHKQVSDTYISVITNDGSAQWIQTTLTPIYKNNKVDKVVFIDSDITALKEAEKQITIQRNQLEQKNDHITQSINYAQKLQQAILPSETQLHKLFREHFVFFKPKDIVSGDFYWAKDLGDKVLFSVIDCTGHGVPGAFMTIFANNLLEMITNQMQIIDPATILNTLNLKLRESLSKGDEEVTDGMELIICLLDKVNHKITYAGAFSSMYVISNEELKEYKTDIISIGSISDELYQNFELNLKQNSLLYLFTDGFADQKGGEKGKKLMYKTLRDTLLTNHQSSLDTQKKELEILMRNWMGSYSQIDDMCIFGIKI
ncbi:MAG: tetratricopeptide repeat protein [Bacteroidia bacterium]|nr:tetratricopeptide repeat protein [Bacteroidia bacterium]